MAVRTITLFVILGLVAAIPADLYDNANANDVDINSVHSDKKYSYDVGTIKVVGKEAEAATTEPTSTVKVDLTFHGSTTKVQNQAGAGFSRLIDDIFNIPITVLQSVAKLLTNPFKQQAKSPDTSSTY